MTPVGSLDDWINLIDSQVPDILALVIETWGAMPAPAANAKEDPISMSFCRLLKQSRDRCDLPFRIDYQMVELGAEAGQDQGRMDITFSPPISREDIYFCLECKRLNVKTNSGIRPYFREYVRFGMLRFVLGKYAKVVRHGGMLAFVLDGNVPAAIAGVEANIRSSHSDLGMEPPGGLSASSLLSANPHVRETHHRRGADGVLFAIHHLFLAG